MPRPRKNPLPVETPQPTEEPTTLTPEGVEGVVAPRRRRRRRTPATTLLPEQSNETSVLVDSVLRSRGAKGATPDMLQSVITWARSIRAEGDSLKELSGRPRRQKTQAPMERIARFEMNRALLDGIIAGTVTLDVQEDGSLQFFHREYTNIPAAPAETTPESAPAEEPAAD